MTDRIGQKFGNYHLVRLLGEGGFAEVYLGEHIHLGTQATGCYQSPAHPIDHGRHGDFPQ